MSFEALKTPKTANPQSPAEAQSALQQQQLLSPFARHRPPATNAIAANPPGVSAMQRAMASAESARHRLSALGSLPVPLSSALRQRELHPGADRCSVGCGTGGLTWAALGGTLYVWRAAAPQGCIRLASPLPSEEISAQRVCHVQPNVGVADEVLLLCCWSSHASCRLSLYRLEALSEPPRLASPPPICELAVPLPAQTVPLFLRATPGTIAPAAAAAAALLGASGSQLFGVGLQAGGTPAGGKPSYALRLAPMERSSGSISRVITAVSSIFSAAPRSGSTATLTALAVGADWMVTLSSEAAAAVLGVTRPARPLLSAVL